VPEEPAFIPFVQLELPGPIGLAEGRYLARDGEGEQVLIVRALRARRQGRLRRRPRAVQPSEPQAVPLTRATIAGAERFTVRATAASWLEAAARGGPPLEGEVRKAVRLLNRALHAQRLASGDPLVQDVGATRALAIRIGYGTGEQLSEGRWTEARQLPAERHGRLEGVDPRGRLAALLSGREEAHPAETLLLRSRLDLNAGRRREAAWQLRAAIAAIRQDPRLR
jgi:hypothetical protein